MPQENVDTLRRAIDAGNRDDLDGWLASFASEGELHTTGRFADEGVHRGHAGLRQLWTEFREDIGELRPSVADIRAVGDKVFVAGAMTGHGKQSDAAFEGRPGSW